MMKIFYAFTCFLTLICAHALAVNNPKQYMIRADSLYRQSQFDSALYYYQAALKMLEPRDTAQKVEIRNDISSIYLRTRQFDLAKPFLEETQQLAELNLSSTHPEMAHLYNQLGRYSWFHGQYAKGLEYLYTAKTVYTVNEMENPELLMTIYANLGFAHGFGGGIDSSVFYFNESVALAKNLENPLKLADRLSDLSFAYTQKGDYESALDVMQQSLEINKKHLPANHASIGKNYNNLTYITIEHWDHDLAIRYANEALKIIEQNEGLQSYSAAIAYMNLAAAYGNKEEWNNLLANAEKAEAAFLNSTGPATPYLGNVYLLKGYANQFLQRPELELEYLTKSLNFKTKVFGKFHPEVIIAYRELGDYYRRNTQTDKAISALQESLAICDSLGLNNYLTNESLITLSQVYKENGNLSEALNTIQQALMVLEPSFDQKSVQSNPSVSDTQTKMNLLLTLKVKTGLLADLYRQEPDENNLKAALSTVEVTNQLIDSIRSSYKTNESKQLLVKNAIPFYEDAISLAFQAYQSFEQQDYLNLAFQFFEKNKSLLLLEGIRESRARTFAGLPEDLLKKERQLKFDLSYYRQQFFEAKNQSDSAKMKEFRQLMTANQLAYQELVETLEDEYPDYYQYKYQWKPVALQDMQKELLTPTSGLIEYFVGEKSIYIFAAGHRRTQLFRVPVSDQYTKLMGQLRNQLIDYQGSRDEPEAALQQYRQVANRLYELILKEPLLALGDEIQDVIIVPDGQLGYLPFEALVMDVDDRNSYLINRYSFSYTYSATLLNQLQKEKPGSQKQQYAGFAPNYEEGLLAMLDTDDSNLLRAGNFQLPGAVNEVERISDIMQGKAWLANQATEQNFKQNADGYGILHLAMHGLLNDQDPMLSKLLFSQSDTIEDGFLNAAEIYNLQLNAQLAVLSACNTASGKINRGEGIMSLSRAFMYAGCPSIVASLWKAPDAATNKIMVNFYENLKQGMTKNEAIRQAKLLYMQDNPGISSHPFFWSTFVPIGDMQPIQRTGWSQQAWWKWLLIAVISLLVFFMLRRVLGR